jgi:hypothetical protein
MDKSGAGAGFLRELRFPLPIYIPSASPQSSSLSPEAGTKPGVAAVPIAPQTRKKKQLFFMIIIFSCSYFLRQLKL